MCCTFHFIQENPLNAELNPVSHLLALVVAHHILHISRVRDNEDVKDFCL